MDSDVSRAFRTLRRAGISLVDKSVEFSPVSYEQARCIGLLHVGGGDLYHLGFRPTIADAMDVFSDVLTQANEHLSEPIVAHRCWVQNASFNWALSVSHPWIKHKAWGLPQGEIAGVTGEYDLELRRWRLEFKALPRAWDMLPVAGSGLADPEWVMATLLGPTED